MNQRLPPRNRRAFVDSGAYFALLDRRDQHHADAVAIARRIARDRYRQFTTNSVIIESHALMLNHLGRPQAAQFLRDISDGNTVIVRMQERDEERAKEIIFHFVDKDYSFTDALSFVAMEQLGITEAFAFDRHFIQYGFHRLTP